MAGKKPIENVDYMLARQKTKQRIQAVIKRATKLSPREHFTVTCKRFLNCVEPEKVPGTNPLPLVALSSKCHIRDKHECVLVLISRLLQNFHEFTPENKLTQMVTLVNLKYLKKILDEGLKVYDLKGEKYPGYYLAEKI